MLHRPQGTRTKARSAAQARWRARERQGQRLAPVPVSAAILGFLERHYSGAFDPDDLGSVGELIGRILEISSRET